MPKYKLKDSITEDDLRSAGFEIHKPSIVWYHQCATKDIEKNELYIPLEESPYGNRIIQYATVDSLPEELLAEDIEDLIDKGWVEEVESNG